MFARYSKILQPLSHYDAKFYQRVKQPSYSKCHLSHTMKNHFSSSYVQPIVKDLQLRNKIQNQVQNEHLPQKQKLKIPKLKIGANKKEILEYYDTYQKVLKPPHLMIVMSRLGHLKNERVDQTDSRVLRLINDIGKIGLHNNPKQLCFFIKYTAMSRIRERNLWRRYMTSLQKIDLKDVPHYFTYILTSLKSVGFRDEGVWSFLEEEAHLLLNTNRYFSGVRMTQNVLEGFSHRQLKSSELEQLLAERLIKQIPFQKFPKLASLFKSSAKIKIQNEYLWQQFNHWIKYKLTANEDIQLNEISQIVYSMGEVRVGNLSNFSDDDFKKAILLLEQKYGDQISQMKLLDNLTDSDKSEQELNQSSIKEQIMYYVGMLKIYQVEGILNSSLKVEFNSFIQDHKQDLNSECFSLLIEPLFHQNDDSQLQYYEEGTVEIIREYILTKLIELNIFEYIKLFELVKIDKRFQSDKINNCLIKCIDFYIQNNKRNIKAIQQIFQQVQEASLLTQEELEHKQKGLQTPFIQQQIN